MTDPLTPAFPALDLGRSDIIAQLWAFKSEGNIPDQASATAVPMFAGRDNIHGAILAATKAARSSYVMNMYGMDDPEIMDAIWDLCTNPKILCEITLDKSQAGGVAEHKLLDSERSKSLAEFNSHIVIGQSATHQISHTKAGCIDGVLCFHGSVNLSASGEGEFVAGRCGPGGAGFRAQNNSLSWHTDPLFVSAFRDELAKDRLAMLQQCAKP